MSQPKINPLLRGEQALFEFSVIAHRGGRAYAPDNTIAAMDKAIKMGAHVIEFDVHATADNVPVVLHDTSLLPIPPVDAKPQKDACHISRFTLREVKGLDAGSWYAKEMAKPVEQRSGILNLMTPTEEKTYVSQEDIEYYRSGKVKLSTPDEVLSFLQDKECYLNLELRQVPKFYPYIATSVLNAIEKYQVAHRTLVSSFDHCLLADVKKQIPNIATGVLLHDRIYQIGRYCTEILDADAYHPCAANGSHVNLGTASLLYEKSGVIVEKTIEEALEAKLAINVWTENCPQRMETLYRGGVTGIVTDYPNRLIDMLKNLKKVPLAS